MGALPWFYRGSTVIPGKSRIWRRYPPVTEPKYNFTWGCCGGTMPLGTAGSQAQLLGSLVLQKSVCKREGSPLHHPLTISGAYHLGLSSHLFGRPWRPVWSVLVVGWGIPQNSLWVGWLLFSDFKKFLASSSFSLWLSSLHSKAGRILDLTWHWEVLALTFNWRDSPWPRFYACVETLAAKKNFPVSYHLSCYFTVSPNLTFLGVNRPVWPSWQTLVED